MATVHSFHGNHPCFSPGARKRVGRLHLPVAPRAMTRVRFGGDLVFAQALAPSEALALLDSVIAQGTELGMVGITGPGDPLATAEHTLETLKLVRAKYPNLPMCLTTSGLGGENYADDLAEFGLSHVTVLVDAVAPKVAEMIYAWIRPGTRNLCLPDAAKLLIREQARAIEAFVKAGVPVKVNTTVYKGSNEVHVKDVASTVAGLGASIMAVMPYRAPVGSEDYLAVQPGLGIMREVREAAGRYIKLMPQEETCGWDLVGLDKPSSDSVSLGPVLPKPSGPRVNVAVASESGMEIDLHLGQAPKFLIYGPREDGLPCLLGTRPAPAPGGGDSRWEELAMTLSDCFVLLAAGAGESPRKILSKHGIQVLVTNADAEGAVDVLFGGGKKGKGCGHKRQGN